MLIEIVHFLFQHLIRPYLGWRWKGGGGQEVTACGGGVVERWWLQETWQWKDGDQIHSGGGEEVVSCNNILAGDDSEKSDKKNILFEI